MSLPGHVWSRLRNITADEIMAALRRDGWTCDTKGGSEHIYRSGDGLRRVSIHYHPGKTFGPKLLKGLLSDIGWSEADLKRLKMM